MEFAEFVNMNSRRATLPNCTLFNFPGRIVVTLIQVNQATAQ
jgi:hypothetical protein